MRIGLFVIALAGLWISPCLARTIIVDDNGPADFNNIQAAINDANNGDTVVVQQGTYTGDGNRDIDFSGKAITVQGTDSNDPCIVSNTIIDCQGDISNRHRGFKFVTGESTNSILSGITIIDGYAPDENIFGDFNSYGGAIYCYGGSPTIKNCTMINNSASRGGAVYFGLSAGIIKDSNFMNNTASFHGGAILCRQSQVTISNSSFQSNFANSCGGAIYSREGNDLISDCNVLSNDANYGGGIYCNSTGGSYLPVIQNCTVNSNVGWLFGGGIHISNNAIIKNCIISYNQGLNSGGVSFTNSSDPIMTNSIILGNKELFKPGVDVFGGGGIQVQSDSRARIINCTIINNNMTLAGGGICVFRAMPVVENCIIWGNTYAGRTDLNGRQICLNSSTSTITLLYNDIEGGIEHIALEFGGHIGLEVGNIDVDPCFADPCHTDYHLKSAAGRWDPNIEMWVNDANTSLCIDTGNPGCPLGDEPEDINNVRINMGAYGGTALASKTPSNWHSLGDLTNDWQIDLSDVEVFTSNWLMTDSCLYGDLNRDQTVDFGDFAVFGNAYNQIE